DRIPSGYEIVINGGRTPMGLDAVAWARQGQALGAGEIVVNSIDADGTRAGYEIRLTRLIADAVGIPVIASGGGGLPEHLYEVLTDGHADAALVASMLHYGEYTVPEIKDYLLGRGLKMRPATRQAVPRWTNYYWSGTPRRPPTRVSHRANGRSRRLGGRIFRR